MQKLKVYIDEFGTNSLETNKLGVTSHFILAAILVDETSKEKAHNTIGAVRTKYFQGSEIKSSKVKNSNTPRRLAILKTLCEIDFIVYAIVVDKNEKKTNGHSIKQSFYKYFHKEITADLNKINSEIEFSSDQIGSDKFMEGFIKYLQKNTIQYTLFNIDSKYQFTNSKNDDLIQLSDFIVGSLGKAFNLKERHEDADDLINVLKERLHVRFWPEKFDNYLVSKSKYTEHDKEISGLGLELSHAFVESFKQKSDEVIQLQILVLNHLRLMHRISPQRFIPTYELMLKLGIWEKWSIQDFRRKIIGSLRDNNVIIVSSQEGGYKLPVNINDINKFINRYNSILHPMVNRLMKCRRNILLRTVNKLDILNQSEYASLKTMIDAVE